MRSLDYSAAKTFNQSTTIAWYFICLVEASLLLRFVIKFIGSNPEAGFSNSIYGITNIFLAPFLSVFRMTNTESNFFEWSNILAMLVYLLIAVGIIIKDFVVMPRPLGRLH